VPGARPVNEHVPAWAVARHRLTILSAAWSKLQHAEALNCDAPNTQTSIETRAAFVMGASMGGVFSRRRQSNAHVQRGEWLH